MLFPDGTTSPANVIYDLVNSDVVDGLVTWASSVGGSLEHDETVAFHQHYHPLPIVSITLPMDGYPTVLIDSYAGMRDVLAHLIEFHGYRRLAFIHGPETHFYAQERYRAYVDALETHDIPLDPNLVTEYGDFAQTAGSAGIRLLLDERKLQPKVVTLDLRELRFLNSAGIDMLLRFTLKMRKLATRQIIIRGAVDIPWQGRSLPNFTRLMPELELRLERASPHKQRSPIQMACNQKGVFHLSWSLVRSRRFIAVTAR